MWRAFPAAIRNGFFEPLPGSGGQPVYLVFSIELLLVWGVVLLAGIRALRTFRPLLAGTHALQHPISNYGEFAAVKTIPPPHTPASPKPAPTDAPATTPPAPRAGPAPGPQPALAPRRPLSAFPAACLLFALGGMLTIGFFVPFAGTIVRYRSIYLPFLLAPALHTLRQLPVIQPLNRWLNNKL
jgi:hypothetical protein